MNNLENTHSKNRNIEKRSIKGFILFYIAIAFVSLAIAPWIFSSDWISSSDFHACIEIIGSFIAVLAGVVCITYFFGLSNRYFLIIGLGFFIAGSEDFIHGLLSFERLFISADVDFTRFIPGTYVAGRTILAIMTIAAPFLEYVTKKTKNVKYEAWFFSLLAIIVGGGVTALAFTLPLPKFIYPDQLISRPVDFISAMLFLIAFVLVLRRFIIKRDIFSGMLLGSILFNLGGQVYMSFSKQLYDVFFDLAHYANVFSYIMPVLGIALQGLEEMESANLESAKRKRIEDDLRKARGELEIRVEERTAELLKSTGYLKQEITERKQAEEKIKQMAEEWEITFNSITDLISIQDKDFRIIKVNKAYADALKMKPEEIIGKTCYEVFHRRKEPWPNCPHKQVMETKKPVVIEFFESHLGIYCENTVSPIFDEKGEVVATVHVAKDITERKLAQEQEKVLMKDLEETNRIMIGRELKMIELKKEVNELSEELGKPTPYDVS